MGTMGAIVDNPSRHHQPAAALAALLRVAVFKVHPQPRHHDAAVLAADVVVSTMPLDVEVFRLIHNRRLLGRPSRCELNDDLPDVQTWNRAHAFSLLGHALQGQGRTLDTLGDLPQRSE